MLAMSENVYERILEISRIIAHPLPQNDWRHQVFPLVHYIACDSDICKRVKATVPLSIEKAQAIMDHLQYVSRGGLIFELLGPPHPAFDLKTLDEHRGRDHRERGRVLNLLQDISDLSDRVPSGLWLTGEVQNVRLHRTGGEADIDVGEYNGLQVACRNIKIEEYGNDPVKRRKASGEPPEYLNNR